jgi:hypothetical protein
MRPPHGFVVLTHAHPAQLRRLAGRLHRSFDGPPVVVHHDFGQSPCAPDGLPPGLTFVRDWVPTRWATWSLVEATLRALRDLAARPDAPEWVTLLSGADYPVRPAAAILRDLEAGGADAYVQHVRVDPAYPPAAGADSPALGFPVGEGRRNHRRSVRRYFGRRIRARVPGLGAVVLARSSYPALVRRLAPYGPGRWCFVGSQFFTLRQSAVRHLLDWHAANAWLAGHLAHREAPDETYVHTVLANSPQLRVAPTNFRFVDWRAGGPNPRTLDAGDLPALLASGAHFARKFAPDAPVLDALDAHLDAHLAAHPDAHRGGVHASADPPPARPARPTPEAPAVGG